MVTSGNTARVAGVNNTGTLNINNNSFLELNGTLTNNGVLNLQSAGNATDLRAVGNQSILGTGTINLTNTTANRIFGAAPGNSLTLGAGQTLQGAGSIGAGTNFNFTNNGTMRGNLGSALTFSSTGTMLNNGLVRADGGNVLVTGGTTFGQTGIGGLSAINGGVVTINADAVISGGTLATADTGQFTTTSGNTATLANLSNTGTFNVVNNSNLRLQGTVTNTGALNLRSVGNSHRSDHLGRSEPGRQRHHRPVQHDRQPRDGRSRRGAAHRRHWADAARLGASSAPVPAWRW